MSTLRMKDDSRSHDEEALSALVEKFYAAWTTHRPVAAALWGGDAVGRFEDVSEYGLASWNETLSGLEVTIEQFAPATTIGVMIHRQLRRFAREERLKVDLFRVFSSHTTAYLQLCAFALLLLQIQRQDVSAAIARELEEATLAACVDWLSVAAARAEARTLRHTSSDRAAARHIAQTIVSVSNASAAERAASALHALAAVPDVPPPTTQRLALNVYLRDVLGITDSREELAALLDVELNHALDQIDACSEINDDGPVPTGGDCLDAIRTAIAMTPDVCSGSFRPQGDQVLSVPVVRPYVQDALYVPASGRTTVGTLVFPGLPNLPRTRSAFARLALAIAHELQPGHATHLAKVANPTSRRTFVVTRSMIGLEGWACWAESAITTMPHIGAQGLLIANVYRARRAVSAIRLMSAGNQRALFEDRLRHRLGGLLAKWSDEVLRGEDLGLPAIAYAVGLLRTQEALRQLKLIERNVEDYLSYGPFLPTEIVDAIRATTDTNLP